MSKEFEHILAGAKALHSKERFALVEALLATIKEEFNEKESPAQITELDKRMEAFRKGIMKIVPGHLAMEKLSASAKK